MLLPTISSPNTFPLLLPLLLTALLYTQSTPSPPDTFVYVGCSPTKYTSANSRYDTSVDSVLSSVVNAAPYSYYNNFTAGSHDDVVYGIFQCRPDISNSDCAACASRAVSQLGVLCSNSVGAAVQLDGCYVRYDNATFLGVEDKTLVSNKCGPQVSGGSGLPGPVLDYLTTTGQQMFRVGQVGGVNGVALCVGDLSVVECQDCLGDAIQRLRTSCGLSAWGDVYLAKCYARFSEDGSHSFGQSDSIQDDETEKTLAILIGIIAAVALLVIFLAFLRRLCEGKDGK